MPTFDTSEPISATVDLAVAQIHLTAGVSPRTVVDVRPSDPLKEKDVRAAEATTVGFTDGRLLIETPRRQAWHRRDDGSVDVTVELPAGSHLTASVGLGDLRSDGRLGDCRVTTGCGKITLAEAATLDLTSGLGDITVEHATGRAEATTGSGDLRLAALDGGAVLKSANGDAWVGVARDEIRLQTANGRIAVDRAHAGVEAKTANGDIRVAEVARGTVVLESHLGDIEVGVREGSAAWLDVRSALGKVFVELDDADTPDPTAETVSVRARTSLGKIRVRRP
jgi:hypothetical protein